MQVRPISQFDLVLKTVLFKITDSTNHAMIAYIIMNLSDAKVGCAIASQLGNPKGFAVMRNRKIFSIPSHTALEPPISWQKRGKGLFRVKLERKIPVCSTH